jgi:hypothetical protein
VKDMMEKEEVYIIFICIYYFLLNKDRIYEWIKRFVTTGPNGKIRPFNLNDLMEDNKILNLRAVEDVINKFIDEGKILINLELSSKRVVKYDLNHMYEMMSTIDEVTKHQTSSNSNDLNN